jgi:hypothetical protein
MKRQSNLHLVLLIVIVGSLGYFLWWKRQSRPQPTQEVPVVILPAPPTNHNVFTNYVPIPDAPWNRMTDIQRASLAAKFREKMKPAADKWFNAYSNHLSIQAINFLPENYVQRLGTNETGTSFFTFMFGDTTFTLQNTDDSWKVSYLMASSAKALSQLPSGAVPNLHLPITRNEVIAMVKADIGHVPTEAIIINPTGTGSAMNGGVNVRIGPPNNIPAVSGPDKLDLTFDSNSTIVYYLRDITY